MRAIVGPAMNVILAALAVWPAAAHAEPRNVILFVADGLRSAVVTPQTAPALAAVRDQGVDFHNSHALYPTITTPNASAIATGHRLGDTGDFGNLLYVEKPFDPPYASPIQPLEDDVVLGLMNARYGGDYLNETSLLQAARAKGYQTAALGKLGPTAIQDVTARSGDGTIIIDDATGWPGGEGITLAPEIIRAIKAAGLEPRTPDRGRNGWPGAYNMAGVQVANVEQQDWFTAVAAKVLLPRFKVSGKPFVMVFWSRDPDGTQHNQGDSLNKLVPGINGPTSLAAIRNASNDLGALRDALVANGLDNTTDVIVTADHGFSVISKQSATSGAAKLRFPDVVRGFLPPGFLAIDLAAGLGLNLYDPNGFPVALKDGFYPRRGGAILAADPAKPQVVITMNGGSDLIYLPGADQALAARIVRLLTEQDYVGAIFARDDLGGMPGALPSSVIGMAGSALTPAPAIIVGFRSFSTGCDNAELCAAEVGDTDLQQGQGMHGSFGRQDTHNFMAAIGPDFRAGFVDPAPVGNADLTITLAHVLGLNLHAKGHATGRVLSEALAVDGDPVTGAAHTLASSAAANGFTTTLRWQDVSGTPYFDAAGMTGRTVGLAE